ncbi:iron-containing alcohol dehydrogenase [Neobacillus rhizophilus]|uniref:Iron-containing alcohol dehydrogenase n=1 Tax=Neobacillus rhizophilus TaxID=2833579 RepID=A0A942YV83_9BACI|nr:iron-containing alcohol dehydrogenase [Neobacillus rhizophilus]MBS4212730.1 iron-containing alcohol dehydrogenase [Neobacillus rhizophilus]MBU8915158.1 iron-containing alcohol dehydrogenase [Bacillus sp. FJAT-29953]
MLPMKLAGEYLVFGENSLEYLTQLQGSQKRALIVIGGESIKKTGYLPKIEAYLKEANFSFDYFTGVEPDPSFYTVQKGAQKLLAFQPDWIIAVGGGSVMDAAKAMWIFYEYPEYKTLADICPPNQIPPLRKKAKMCCIPTTSGSGSEVTRSFVITDTETHIKHGIRGMDLIPDIAILEPGITASVPPAFTAATGMDVLTHALEALVSSRAHIVADALAEKAALDVFEYLPQAYREGSNLEAREKLLLASCFAGMAFTNVSLGIVHSIAHAVGGKFGVPHGLANAIILPFVIEFNSQDIKAKSIYKSFAAKVGAENLADAVRVLNEKLDIPRNLKPVIHQDDYFTAAIPELAELASKDGCTKTNPLIPTVEEFKEIIEQIYFGVKVGSQS